MKNENGEILVWRSLLYVPANNPRFIDKAHTRGADAIILDLEDSVPAAERDRARAMLAESVATVSQAGADVLVRINRPDDEAVADVEAAVMPGVTAIKVTKAADAEHVQRVSAAVAARERAREMPEGTIRFVPMIETAAAFFKVTEIAEADPRNVALDVGGEDFALDVRSVPDPETLFLPKQTVQIAARAAGLMPLGTIGTVADYQDLDAYRQSIRRSRKFGFDGASCIHPSVVPLLNEEFSPSADEIDHARRVVEAYAAAEAEGKGAIEIDGKMIDVPVAIRARHLLERVAAIAAREKKAIAAREKKAIAAKEGRANHVGGAST